MTSAENFQLLLARAKELKAKGKSDAKIAHELYLNDRDLRLLWTMDGSK
jgi:orotate phosphoribosyltransferase-like protein